MELIGIFAWLAEKRIPKSLIKPLLIGGGLVALIVGIGVAKCRYDNAIRKADRAQIAAASAQVQATNAKASAAAQTAMDADTGILLQQKKERDHAIAKTLHHTPDPAQLALGCLRLRQAGDRHGYLPPCAAAPLPRQAAAHAQHRHR